MKYTFFFSALLALLLCQPNTTSAQTTASATTGMTTKFKVYGNCGMCEKRIEKAAKKVKGVNSADWDVDTQILTVNFNEAKVKPSKIQKAVAAVGHDTETVRAKDKTYAKLPGCCQYDRAGN